MGLDLLVRNGVRGSDRGPARVVVVELPRGEGPVFLDPRGHFDESGRAEIGPGELLLAGPGDLDRLPHGLGEPRGLDRGVHGVFAAVPGAHVRDDDADLVRGEAERPDYLVADPERALRPGPDGDLAVGPLGDGHTRFERAVGDVGDRVVRLYGVVGGLEARLD